MKPFRRIVFRKQLYFILKHVISQHFIMIEQVSLEIITLFDISADVFFV